MSKRWSAGDFLAKAKELTRRLRSWHIELFLNPVPFVYNDRDARRWTHRTFRDALPKVIATDSQRPQSWQFYLHRDGGPDAEGYVGDAYPSPDRDADRPIAQWLMGVFWRHLDAAPRLPALDYLKDAFEQILDLPAWVVVEPPQTMRSADKGCELMVTGRQVPPDRLETLVDAAEKLLASAPLGWASPGDHPTPSFAAESPKDQPHSPRRPSGDDEPPTPVDDCFRHFDGDFDRALFALDHCLRDFDWKPGKNYLDGSSVVGALRSKGVTLDCARFLLRRLIEHGVFDYESEVTTAGNKLAGEVGGIPLYEHRAEPEATEVLVTTQREWNAYMMERRDLASGSSELSLLRLLQDAPDREAGIAVVDLPEAMRDWRLVTACEHAGLVEFVRRRHVHCGDKLVLERGWEVAELAQPGRKLVKEMIEEGMSEEVHADIRLRLRITYLGDGAAVRAAMSAGVVTARPDSPGRSISAEPANDATGGAHNKAIARPTVWYHGERSYSADEGEPVVVTQEQHNVLQAFLEIDAALDTNSLRKSGASNVAKVISALAGKFPLAVRKPSTRGEGYFIRVRRKVSIG